LVALVFLILISTTISIAFIKYYANKTTYKPVHNSVLELNFSGPILESLPLSFLGSNKNKMGLHVIKSSIQQATFDPHIKAICLNWNVSMVQANWAALEEIRLALLAFKQAGKTIVAYGDAYSQKAYYLASLADEIVLNPSGYLGFQGFSATIQFYLDLFKKVYVKPIIFKIGDYKSAVEPFCRHEMSKESRQQTQAYLDATYTHFLSNVSMSRHIPSVELKKYADNMSAVLPEDALRVTLVTKIGYKEDVKALIKEHLSKADGTIKLTYVDYDRYYDAVHKPSTNWTTDSLGKIAVVIVEGTIIDGSSSPGYVGDKNFVDMMQSLQKNDAIKAVVLRINSPGGSSLASDNMWHAIESLKKSKPIVASLSGVAASGGYYIAAPCHAIVAQPTTLTGSIGIYGIFFDTDELIKKIGIQSDVVKTAPSADFLNPRVKCTDVESKLVFKMLQGGYDAFLDKVAVGRNIPLEEVKKIASGRIFAGTEALKYGLLDELGSVDTAIQKAASLANLGEKYRVTYIKDKPKFDQLLDVVISNVKTQLFAMIFSEAWMAEYLQTLHNIKKESGLQVKFPYAIDIN